MSAGMKVVFGDDGSSCILYSIIFASSRFLGGSTILSLPVSPVDIAQKDEIRDFFHRPCGCVGGKEGGRESVRE